MLIKTGSSTSPVPSALLNNLVLHPVHFSSLGKEFISWHSNSTTVFLIAWPQECNKVCLGAGKRFIGDKR